MDQYHVYFKVRPVRRRLWSIHCLPSPFSAAQNKERNTHKQKKKSMSSNHVWQ